MRRSRCHYLGTPLAKALSAGCTADFKELEPGNTPTRLLARVQGVAPHSGGGEDEETPHFVRSLKVLYHIGYAPHYSESIQNIS